MILINRENVEVGVKWTGQFRWKPEWCGQLDNFHRVENGKDFRYVNTWSYYVPTLVQVYWLRFSIYVKIKPKLIGPEKPRRYVPFEDTHLELMDIPEGNWND